MPVGQCRHIGESATVSAYLCDLPAFVVPPKQRHVRWVPRFAQHQQREDLQAVVASVHEVAHENVVRAGRLPARIKQLEQVMELAMNVSTDLQSTQPVAMTRAVSVGVHA